MTDTNSTAPETHPAHWSHALVRDVTATRCTVVMIGTEDECRGAATDDRDRVMVCETDEALPEIGERAYWSDAGGDPEPHVWGK